MKAPHIVNWLTLVLVALLAVFSTLFVTNDADKEKLDRISSRLEKLIETEERVDNEQEIEQAE